MQESSMSIIFVILVCNHFSSRLSSFNTSRDSYGYVPRLFQQKGKKIMVFFNDSVIPKIERPFMIYFYHLSHLCFALNLIDLFVLYKDIAKMV